MERKPERKPEDVVNFAAGPAKLPREVLLEAQVAALNWEGTGIGVMELSHRSKEFDRIQNECIGTLRRLIQIPDNYKVLLLQGGGTGEFAALPLNLTQSSDEVADYFVTGTWSQKSAKEAEKYIKVNYVLPKTSKYIEVPHESKWQLTPEASYVYYCDNETVHGVEFPSIPNVGEGKTLVCDMSSNFLTRPIDVSKYGVIFAGAQKNVGCSGVTIVIIREDLIGKTRKNCPIILDYTVQAGINSLYNTPCTWAVYILGQVLKWVEKQGGVTAMQANSATKSTMVFDVIASSNGFYYLPVAENSRSRVNVPFRVGSEENREKLEAEFLEEASSRGLLQLKGHRSVGGIRASLYNALMPNDVEKLTTFMKEFMEKKK
ncbi:PREDICTED: phosphoserine aminotransferase-like [Amphimedon queenslandica]|uniref:Phosphoserine aminotransferase n=1 Tax=Amphimedon queenslandica TaxID=400682 RepID=A0A1X7VVV6_AMPQE|nr:PREDICTED: phosphoserine aminotransferase-like [Amphimedon queenslandica]|eukprot:XP_003382931.1 PREDICTED: phosphoserine aminotransferase-like [Amphimedon queenslandica]